MSILKNKLFYLLLSSLIVLSGCMPTTLHEGPKFVKARPPADNQALVYIYRIGMPPYYIDTEIAFNHNQKITLPNKAYKPVYVKAGKYKVSVTWPSLSGGHDDEKSFTFEAGKTYYLALTTADPTNLKSILELNHWFGDVSKKNAMVGITQCMLVK